MSSNPELDELRKATAGVMVRMYAAMAVLETTIEVCPNMNALKTSSARKLAVKAMDDFVAWAICAATGEEIDAVKGRRGEGEKRG